MVATDRSPDGLEEIVVTMNESNQGLKSEGVEVTQAKRGKRGVEVQRLRVKDVFWKVWALLGWKTLPNPNSKEERWCYMFELLLEDDIFRYKEQEKPEIVHHFGPPVLVLHGARNLTTQHEASPEV